MRERDNAVENVCRRTWKLKREESERQTPTTHPLCLVRPPATQLILPRDSCRRVKAVVQSQANARQPHDNDASPGERLFMPAWLSISCQSQTTTLTSPPSRRSTSPLLSNLIPPCTANLQAKASPSCCYLFLPSFPSFPTQSPEPSRHREALLFLPSASPSSPTSSRSKARGRPTPSHHSKACAGFWPSSALPLQRQSSARF